MRPTKLTEEVFLYVQRAIMNKEWTWRWKYPLNNATVRRIKKSASYEDYIGPDQKYKA